MIFYFLVIRDWIIVTKTFDLFFCIFHKENLDNIIFEFIISFIENVALE